MTEADKDCMRRAIELAEVSVESGGGPFGAVVVKDGEIVGEGRNMVTATNDPTAHAEVIAIREACRNLGSFQLDGCVIYASCEPCPMCLGAIYWARPQKVYFACTRQDAAAAGFDDSYIYDEITLPANQRKHPINSLLRDEGLQVFQEWMNKPDKISY